MRAWPACLPRLRTPGGSLRLGAWRSYTAEPSLSWTARQQANGWVLEGAELL